MLALALAGCSDTNDPGNPEVTGVTEDTPQTAGTPTLPADDVEAARVTAEQFYDAVGLRDCITLRGLSTVPEQREDEAWATCIDVLLGVVGDDFEFSLDEGTAEGTTITFVVSSSSTVDGETVGREDPLVLLDENGAWRVDDSVVTAG